MYVVAFVKAHESRPFVCQNCKILKIILTKKKTLILQHHALRGTTQFLKIQKIALLRMSVTCQSAMSRIFKILLEKRSVNVPKFGVPYQPN